MTSSTSSSAAAVLLPQTAEERRQILTAFQRRRRPVPVKDELWSALHLRPPPAPEGTVLRNDPIMDVGVSVAMSYEAERQRRKNVVARDRQLAAGFGAAEALRLHEGVTDPHEIGHAHFVTGKISRVGDEGKKRRQQETTTTTTIDGVSSEGKTAVEVAPSVMKNCSGAPSRALRRTPYPWTQSSNHNTSPILPHYTKVEDAALESQLRSVGRSQSSLSRGAALPQYGAPILGSSSSSVAIAGGGARSHSAASLQQQQMPPRAGTSSATYGEHLFFQMSRPQSNLGSFSSPSPFMTSSYASITAEHRLRKDPTEVQEKIDRRQRAVQAAAVERLPRPYCPIREDANITVLR